MKELLKCLGLGVLALLAFFLACGIFGAILMGIIYFFGIYGLAVLAGILIFIMVCNGIYICRNGHDFPIDK
jgi:hypothetical protein